MAWHVTNFVALAVTLMCLAVISTGLRFWARKKSKSKFGAEDALIIPAAVSKAKFWVACCKLMIT
jgi:hypothetical protein